MSHSLPSKSPMANHPGSVPPFSTPSDSKSTASGSMGAGSESSAKGSSSSTPSEPVPLAATSPLDEASSSALTALINLGLPHLRQLYEALGPLMKEVHEKKKQQRETTHAQEIRHREDLHAQKLRHEEMLYAKEREQALQIRIINHEPYFNVENDRGGWDALTRDQFNDLRDRRKARGNVVSIREPVDSELVGGNDFREEDHVWTGQSDTGSSAVVHDQDTAVELGAGSTSEEDVQRAHSNTKRGKERSKQQAQASSGDCLESDW